MSRVQINRSIPGLVAGILLAGLAVATSTAEPLPPIVEGWISRQTNLPAWKADFIQTRSLKTLKNPLISTGQVWFAAPNRFRWELGRPAQTIAIRNAEEMLVVYPKVKRAERYPLAQAGAWRDSLALLDFGFPRSVPEFNQQFQVEAVETTNSLHRIILKPRVAAARKMISRLNLEIAKESFRLLSAELAFADGSRLRNDFAELVLLPKADPAFFQYELPPDFKVSDPLAR